MPAKKKTTAKKQPSESASANNTGGKKKTPKSTKAVADNTADTADDLEAQIAAQQPQITGDDGGADDLEALSRPATNASASTRKKAKKEKLQPLRIGKAFPVRREETVALRFAERVTPDTPAHGRTTAVAGNGVAQKAMAPFVSVASPVTDVFVDPATKEVLFRLVFAGAWDVGAGFMVVPLDRMRREYPQVLIDYLLSCSVYEQ